MFYFHTSNHSFIGSFRVGVCGWPIYDTYNFWNMEISGQSRSDGGIGLTTAEMQTTNTFLDAGWDFVGEIANGTEDIWWILEG